MHGGDENRVVRVSSLTDEEPLVVVKMRIDIVREVVQEDCGDSRGSVVRKGETPLCRGGSGSVHKRMVGAENRDIGCDWSGSSHRRSEVFASRGGDENIIGVNGNVHVEWGEKEGIEDFLSYLGRSGRHRF